MKKFNITGVCVPEEDYMVDITSKLTQIKKLVDEREYFTINRGRQYGKTTTLFMLESFLNKDYIVISLSFEGLGEKPFSSEKNFCTTFLNVISKSLKLSNYQKEIYSQWENGEVDDFVSLSDHITQICETSEKPYVLMIDEVDKTSNNTIFLNFLSKLRDKFLARKRRKDFTFQSVILAGVYDIKNIKLKLVNEGLHTLSEGETAIKNSPWNIAVDFNIDMSFSIEEIMTMLNSYEGDKKIGMDIREIASEIYKFTSGYPVLVSKICKYIDEEMEQDWTSNGIRRAIKLILKEDAPLFQSLIKNLTNDKELSDLTYQLVMNDVKWTFNIYDPFIEMGARYGHFKDVNGRVQISNRIFEIFLTNYFINQDFRERLKLNNSANLDERGIISNGKFNMQVCLEKFSKYYHKYYSEKDIYFHEKEARILFLMFISSVLNGAGFAELESGLADERSMDVLVTYLGEQFIIETKLWYGASRHENAYEQLLGYMDKMSLNEGYLLTFDLRKNKQRSEEWIEIDENRKIFDVKV